MTLPFGTVYCSLSTPERHAAVTATIKELQPNLTLTAFSSPLEAIAVWEHSKGVVPKEAAPSFIYECYITDAPNQLSDPALVYAIFTKKIPVLHFCKSSNAAAAANASAEDGSTRLPCSNESIRNPLLETTASDSVGGKIEDAVHSYFSGISAKRGRVIVIEGGDGAGKQTQTTFLVKRLRATGHRAETLDFPHDAARYGVLIREALAGHKGNLRDVSPLVFASLYGLNRHDVKPWIDNWLVRGVHVVLDRWTTANYGHQASKFKTDEERDAAIAALRTFEERWLGLPAADRVLYLDLPPEVAHRAMLQDTSRKELDLHEKAGIEYKENVRRAFLWCCGRFPDEWRHVKCCKDQEGGGGDGEERRTREEVHEAIWSEVKGLVEEVEGEVVEGEEKK